MDKIKGTGILILKKLIQDRGEDFERQYVLRLDPEAKAQWESTTLAVSWIPAHMDGPGTLLYETAQVLFPGETNRALRELGKVMAKEGLPRFYQIFIRIPTPQFVFKRVAALWRTFYNTGEASLENISKNRATFVLKNYPEYPPCMREYMVGYLLGMGDLLGLRKAGIRKVEDNPQAWQWVLQWES